MKSLTAFVTESLVTQQINEAFKSSIIRDLFNSSDKNLIKSMLSNIGIKWAEVEDSDLEERSPNDAKKIGLREDTLAIFLGSKGELLGVSNGNWVQITSYAWRGKGRSKPQFASVTAMAKAATNAYVIRTDRFKELSGSWQIMRHERWASKQDAAAFVSNSRILDENRSRYKEILAKRKIAGLIVTPDQIQACFDRYAKLFANLVGSPDWSKISTLNLQFKKFTDAYKDYVWVTDDAKATYEWEVVTAKKFADMVNKIMDEIEAENAEQVD